MVIDPHGDKVYFCDSIGRLVGKELKGVINTYVFISFYFYSNFLELYHLSLTLLLYFVKLVHSKYTMLKLTELQEKNLFGSLLRYIELHILFNNS